MLHLVGPLEPFSSSWVGRKEAERERERGRMLVQNRPTMNWGETGVAKLNLIAMLDGKIPAHAFCLPGGFRVNMESGNTESGVRYARNSNCR